MASVRPFDRPDRCQLAISVPNINDGIALTGLPRGEVTGWFRRRVPSEGS